jgi:hypothetical protein
MFSRDRLWCDSVLREVGPEVETFFSIGMSSVYSGGGPRRFHVGRVGTREELKSCCALGGVEVGAGSVMCVHCFAELVGADLVACVHCFAELVLGVVTVEDDAVDANCDSLDNNFDDAANEGPRLNAISQQLNLM